MTRFTTIAATTLAVAVLGFGSSANAQSVEQIRTYCGERCGSSAQASYQACAKNIHGDDYEASARACHDQATAQQTTCERRCIAGMTASMDADSIDIAIDAADAYERCVDQASAQTPDWYQQCVTANPTWENVCRAWIPIAEDALIANNCADKAAFDADEAAALACTTQCLEYAESRVLFCVDPTHTVATAACAMRIPRSYNACLRHTCATDG